MVAILIKSAKLASVGLLNVFWNILILFFHDITDKVLSLVSNYIVDVVMWPKFGNSRISITVIIASIFKIFDQKKFFFSRQLLLVRVQKFRTGTRYGLEILHQCDKKIKTKRQEVLGVNLYAEFEPLSWIGLRNHQISF